MPRSSCSLSMVAFTNLPDAFPGQVGSQKKDVMGDECMKSMKNDIDFFEIWVEKLPNLMIDHHFFPTKNCSVTGVKPDFQTHQPAMFAAPAHAPLSSTPCTAQGLKLDGGLQRDDFVPLRWELGTRGSFWHFMDQQTAFFIQSGAHQNKP